MTPPREVVAHTSQEEGDYICEMVLKLVRSIVEGRPAKGAPDYDRTNYEKHHPNPTYKEMETRLHV